MPVLHDDGLVRFDVSAFAGDTALGTMSAYWSAGVPLEQLGLVRAEQPEGTPDVTDVERFVILV